MRRNTHNLLAVNAAAVCENSAVRAGQTLTEQRLGFLNFSAAAGIAPGALSNSRRMLLVWLHTHLAWWVQPGAILRHNMAD